MYSESENSKRKEKQSSFCESNAQHCGKILSASEQYKFSRMEKQMECENERIVASCAEHEFV